MTNYERIKNMTVEEMADLFLGLCEKDDSLSSCEKCPLCNDCGIDYGGSPNHRWEAWLKSEVEEE